MYATTFNDTFKNWLFCPEIVAPARSMSAKTLSREMIASRTNLLIPGATSSGQPLLSQK